MDGSEQRFEITIHAGIAEIPEDEWDACACPEAETGRPFDPFSTHRFFSALEKSGSACRETGWTPLHLAARCDGALAAILPLYAKPHSHGEYIFDFGWADAFQRAGGRYYPKLQASVPFTPVTGRRFLCCPGYEQDGIRMLAAAARRLAQNHNLSSLHVTFCSEPEAVTGAGLGFLHRIGEQFHWQNRGYAAFDEFLSELSSRKRKNIRAERRRAAGFGGTIEYLTGTEILPRHWDAFWEFYQDTGSRKWGIPYLTRSFFDHLHQNMRDDILLIMGERGGRCIAGALNFIGRDALFGRYWGCVEHHSCLHFEICYYRAIEFAIANGLQRVEAGAQGPHKLARGYMPQTVHSLHWIENPGFRRAVLDYLNEERREISGEINKLTEAGPFRHTGSRTN
ncbi:MAG: GNAT family N-acetyltransferase [Rhodobacteraceae bacterium]|nr:GNAT family N-acetyltransferase [Paracoccaceae bacterium]